MKRLPLILIFLFSIPAVAQDLNDFYNYNPDLEHRVDTIFAHLNDTSIVGQMIVQATGRLGKPFQEVKDLIRKNQIGGVLLLNGEKEQFKKWVDEMDSLAGNAGTLPLIYSADAEPSLVNRKIKNSNPVSKTNELQSDSLVIEATKLINEDLNYIGIQHNYAPVVDLSPNNAAIRNRSIGNDPVKVVQLSNAFIQESQNNGIIATAKHFPGHGLVSGDTHKQLVTIKGEMQELPVYDSLIKDEVISIMIGHIAVMDNNEFESDSLPASCSRKIVTDLLKKKMGFRGLIVTDALNMGALSTIDNAPFQAAKAGCDMILMPVDEGAFMNAMLEEIQNNPEFKAQVYTSVKKIIRLKVLLGLLDE